MRLDKYLAEQGLAKSRTQAAELISSRLVSVNGTVVEKPSYDVPEDAAVAVAEHQRMVGRGALKLISAIERFGIQAEGKICADIGASTGGFTETLLKNGAKRVYAVDSGHGQLDPTLAEDVRVINLEGQNARYMDGTVIPEKCALVVSDLSFISQTLVIPAIASIMAEEGEFVSLIKPQFECGREALSKGGIVKDKKQHRHAIENVLDSAEAAGLYPVAIIKSPIKGGDGNVEFLMHCKKVGPRAVFDKEITEAVNEQN